MGDGKALTRPHYTVQRNETELTTFSQPRPTCHFFELMNDEPNHNALFDNTVGQSLGDAALSTLSKKKGILDIIVSVACSITVIGVRKRRAIKKGFANTAMMKKT